MAEVAVFSYKETAFLMLKCAVFSYKNHPWSTLIPFGISILSILSPVPPSHSCRDRRANQRRSTCGPLPHQPWVKLEIGSQLDPKIIRGCFPTLCLHPLRIWPQFSKALGITYVGPFSMNYEPFHLLCKCIHINKHMHIHIYILYTYPVNDCNIIMPRYSYISVYDILIFHNVIIYI